MNQEAFSAPVTPHLNNACRLSSKIHGYTAQKFTHRFLYAHIFLKASLAPGRSGTRTGFKNFADGLIAELQRFDSFVDIAIASRSSSAVMSALWLFALARTDIPSVAKIRLRGEEIIGFATSQSPSKIACIRLKLKRIN